jgi:hypothetical protein
MKLNAELVLEVLRQHKAHLTTVEHYKEYAEQHDLPSPALLLKTFGSWNALKEQMGLQTYRKRYSRQELEKILLEHQEHLKGNRRNWDLYAQKHKLPLTITLIQHFGTWENVKKVIGEEVTTRERFIEEREEFLKKMPSQIDIPITTRQAWDQYAKEHKLPVYNTIRKYMEWRDFKKLFNPEIKRIYKDEELIALLQKHREHARSRNSWDEFAKENGFPTSITIHRRFGSWNKAKMLANQRDE